jgi:hypothetical protein
MVARCDQFSDEFHIKLARLWLVEDVLNARDVFWCHFMIASTDMHVCQRRNSRLTDHCPVRSSVSLYLDS